MGKTAKPVTILVMDETLFQTAEVQALKAKGHRVLEAYEKWTVPEIDVIIGPQCWRIEPGLGDLEVLLEMVLKGVRAKKRGTK